MDEDEEVDIMGNFENFMSKNDQDISKISSGQILSCDYTVHPNWLNENSEAGSYWTDSVPKSENLESNVEILQSEEVVIEEPEPVPNIADTEWRGDVGSHEDLVFEDDIPASIEEIVINQSSEDTSQPASTLSESDHFELETAAFETHPPLDNIKFIGPTHSRSLLKVKMETPIKIHDSNSRSGSDRRDRPNSKFRHTLMVNANLLKMEQKSRATKKIFSAENLNSKGFKSRLKNAASTSGSGKFARKNEAIPREMKQKTKPKKYKKTVGSGDENITISHEKESLNTVSVLENPGNLVQLKKYESDSDIEVDIESDSNPEIKEVVDSPETSSKSPPNESANDNPASTVAESQPSEDYELSKDKIEERFSNLSECLVAQLQSNDIPTEELRVKLDEVSELEKFIHSDFFENRTTKTPEQYMRIRNHILSMWMSLKPNYVSKTAVRSGLKHGGDVNCISRIHRLLEQIGAINFGLEGKYFDYVRPLHTFISMFMQVPRNRTNSNSSSIVQHHKERRQRFRTHAYSWTSADVDDADVNYTIVHMDGVIRLNPPPIQKDDTKPRPSTRHIKSELDLIKCLRFSEENPPPFSISITLSTLLCLRLHSLSSNCEVMGFLGGEQSKRLGLDVITLTRYKPCRTSAQSGTACEMCPVSQVEQSASLNSEGCELLGWFHSHPLFHSNPSRTDIRTQREMQLQFSFNNRPFVGVILSCLNFSLKCIYMMPAGSTEIDCDDNNLPYEIDIDIIKDCSSFKVDVKDVLCFTRDNGIDLVELQNKFKQCSETLLLQLGYNCDDLLEDVF